MSAGADSSRRRPTLLGSLPGAGYLADALTLLSALPDVVVTLRSIERHIENVDTEVTAMRQGVDRLAGEVLDLRGEIRGLADGINEVSAAVGRLEPHVSDLSRLARPLRRRRRTDPNEDLVGGVVTRDAPPLPTPGPLDLPER